jgi:hypothetical protein
MARRASAICAAGTVAAFAKTGWVKWTWLFQKPASTVAPPQSRTFAAAGMDTPDRGPTATIVAPSIRTTPSTIGAASGEGCTRPPTSAVTGVAARGTGAGVVPHATARSTTATRRAIALIRAPPA